MILFLHKIFFSPELHPKDTCLSVAITPRLWSPRPFSLMEDRGFKRSRKFFTSSAGIACIALSFVDARGNPISLTRWVRPPTSLLSTSFLQEDDFESLTAVNNYQAEPGTSQPGRKMGICMLSGQGGNLLAEKDLSILAVILPVWELR